MTPRILPEFVRQAGNIRKVDDIWNVHRSSTDRGSPKTNIEGHQLYVPFEDEARAECIRAHEMMHIRLSPTDLNPWIKRKKATADSLMLAEECRINEVLQQQGFDPETHLYDETDEIIAHRFAKQKNLEGVIRIVAATHGTATHQEVLEKIRQGSAEAGDTSIHEGAVDLSKTIKEVLHAYRHMLTSDRPLGRSKSKRMTRGFLASEKLAMVLDQYKSIAKEGGKIPNFNRKAYADEGIQPEAKYGELVNGNAKLTRIHNGNIGKVRMASDVGRSPRRIGRLLTDPYRRIFDRTKRKSGGVVLIDWSGSMSLSSKDILTILKHAPGATIAAYAHPNGSKGIPNFWVLAKDGKMVSDLPEKHGCGNGVDGPALRWALKSRRFTNEMVLWVCDGAVTDGQNDGFYPNLAEEARALVKVGKVVMKKCMEDAVDFLKRVAQGTASPIGPVLVGHLSE